MLIGASGLVGGLTLEMLLKDPEVDHIVLLARTRLPINNPRVIQVIRPLDTLVGLNLKDLGVDRLDAALCAIGSTIKKAGSRSVFKKIDHDYVVNVANLAKNCGALHFGVISALGADRSSHIFYNQVKGEMETSLIGLYFKKLTIIRPSLILGERSEKRFGEQLFVKLSPLINKTLIGSLKKYRGVDGHVIAKYLSQSIHQPAEGAVIIENSELLNI